MWANMKAEFVIDGSRIHLPRIDMHTDGATTVATGDVDMGHWPKQGYQVKSRVNFPRMRELFFKDEKWRLSGDGDFTGTFQLFKGGEDTNRDLTGTFTSDLAGVERLPLPGLYGSLRWTQHGFDVWNAGSQFYGGDAKFVYAIKPLGAPTKPTHHFDATLTGVDLARFTDFEQFPGTAVRRQRVAAQRPRLAVGQVLRASRRGRLSIAPPPGVTPMTASLAAARAADAGDARREWGPFAPVPLPAHLPIAGELTYRFGPDEVDDRAGPLRHRAHARDLRRHDGLRRAIAAAVPRHQPRLAGKRSAARRHHQRLRLADRRGAVRRPRRVRRRDDRPVPRAAGRRAVHRRGSARLRHAAGAPARRTSSSRTATSTSRTASSATATRRSAPTACSRSAIRARTAARRSTRGIRVARRDLDSLRHAFGIDEYPVSGRLSGEFHLTGAYERPVGFGGDDHRQRRRLRRAVSGSDRGAALRRHRRPSRRAEHRQGRRHRHRRRLRRLGLDLLVQRRRPAHSGREAGVRHAFRKAPLSGLAEFTANGSGTFDAPRNDFRYPRRRSVHRRGRHRPGHRDAGAARRRAERSRSTPPRRAWRSPAPAASR